MFIKLCRIHCSVIGNICYCTAWFDFFCCTIYDNYCMLKFARSLFCFAVCMLLKLTVASRLNCMKVSAISKHFCAGLVMMCIAHISVYLSVY